MLSHLTRAHSVIRTSSYSQYNKICFSTASPVDSTPMLKRELRDNILYVTFNRPGTYNAMTVEMGEQFEELVRYTQDAQSASNPEDVVKCVVFTGAGKAFSSGGDRAFLFARHEDTPVSNMAEMSRFYRRFLSVRDIPVPTVAAINGPCAGAGACFTLACDIRIALETAPIGFIFTKLGLHPGLGVTHFLPKLIGHQAAAKLLMTGEMINGRKAYELGLIAEMVPVPEDAANTPLSDKENLIINRAVVDRASEIAKDLAAVHSTASYTLVRTLRAQLGEGLESALLREADAQAASYNEKHFYDSVHASIKKPAKKE